MYWKGIHILAVIFLIIHIIGDNTIWPGKILAVSNDYPKNLIINIIRKENLGYG